MDSLIVNVDVANKRGIFTSSNAIGSYDSVELQVYNLPATVDIASLAAVIYTDDGSAITLCTSFTADPIISGLYNATLSLGTDKSIAYFSAQSPYFLQNLTFILSDTNQLYCNSRLTVKNNPNAVPTSPQPVTTYFIMEAPTDGGYYVRSDRAWFSIPAPSTIVTKNSGPFTADLEGSTPVYDLTDDMTAGEVRQALITLVQYLQSRGIA